MCVFLHSGRDVPINLSGEAGATLSLQGTTAGVTVTRVAHTALTTAWSS